MPFSPRYIPSDLWFSHIVPYYSDTILAKAWQDKCIYNILFPDMRRPRTVVKNMAGTFCDDSQNVLAEQEAVQRVLDCGVRFLVKPSVVSGAGKNIRFYDPAQLDRQAVSDIFRLYKHDYIIQEKQPQHPALAALNPDSLNTLRILTFLHRDQVLVLSAILRVGGPGSEMDNVSRGGFQCCVGPDGRLDGPVLTLQDGKATYLTHHPSGIAFRDVIVPSYDKALEAVRSHAAKMAHFKLIGWDIAIDPEGEPVLVEFNALPGMNQGTCGPTFGDLTDEVLTEVFGRRGERKGAAQA